MHRRTPPRSVVARITAILATFRSGSAHSVTEIARRTGLPVSTTHRMANGLAAWSLRYRRADSTSEIGPAVRGLGDSAWAFSALQLDGPRLLTDLGDATGHRTRLSVLANGRVAHIEKHFGPDPATTFARGATLPLHATAIGKVLLAFKARPSAHVERPLATFTPRTHSSIDQLDRALKAIRRAQLAVNSGEHFPGEVTIAAPIFVAGGAAVAALEVEVTHSQSDFPLCRAALIVAAGAMTHVLEATTTAAHPALGIVPKSLVSAAALYEPPRTAAGG